MRSRFFRRLHGRLLLVLVFCCFCSYRPGYTADIPGNSPSAHELAQRVDRYYNALHSLRVGFTESYQGMGQDRTENGTLLLRKPSKMRWNYAQPPGKVFILDGKYGWFYSPGDAQVERLPASELDDLRSPLRFLLGHTQLEKEFDHLTLSSLGGGFELSGAPKGMEKRVANVAFNVEVNGVIRSITVTETDGARTSFSFRDYQPNAPAPDEDFVFHAPAGIPVVNGMPPV
jgi:outer membrane lipoprotein carrier protein